MITLLSLLLAAMPTTLAQAVNVDLSGTADAVIPAGIDLSVDAGCSGAECLLDIVAKVWLWLRPFFTIIATFLIVRYGVTLIISQEEEKLRKAKHAIGTCLAALMLLYLPGYFVNAFYGGYDIDSGTLDTTTAGKAIESPVASATILTTEIQGIVSWIETFVGVLAVTVIIVSGILAVTSYGKEDGSTQFKRTVGAVVFGVFLIILKQAILKTFGLTENAGPLGPPTIRPAIDKIVQVANGLLEFAGLLAVAVIVYAAVLMILNIANEEHYGRAKGILFRAAIGIITIIASLAVIRFVMAIA